MPPTGRACCAYKPATRRRGAVGAASATAQGRRGRGRLSAVGAIGDVLRQHFRTARSRSPSLNGFASQRQPLSSRNVLGLGAGDVAGDEDDAPASAGAAAASVR